MNQFFDLCFRYFVPCPKLSVLLLALCMFFGAILFTSVGHAGASAYITMMALFGTAPAVMRPTALALNILVAGFGAFRYLRAGMSRWRTVWPLLGAVPLAVAGAVQFGRVKLARVGIGIACRPPGDEPHTFSPCENVLTTRNGTF